MNLSVANRENLSKFASETITSNDAEDIAKLPNFSITLRKIWVEIAPSFKKISYICGVKG